MIFNDKLLFIHIGKTGGISAETFLCSALEAPIFNVKHRVDDVPLGLETNLAGRRHATLAEARDFLRDRGRTLDSFTEIVAVLRNPYDLEVSLFNHYRKELRKRPDMARRAPKRMDIVRRGAFAEFVEADFHHRPGVAVADYVHVDGVLPPNLRLLRFESLESDFRSLRSVANPEAVFPHRNASSGSTAAELLTPSLESRIQKKYAWVFEEGRYQR